YHRLSFGVPTCIAHALRIKHDARPRIWHDAASAKFDLQVRSSHLLSNADSVPRHELLGADNTGFGEVIDVGGTNRRRTPLAHSSDKVLPASCSAADQHRYGYGIRNLAAQCRVIAVE